MMASIDDRIRIISMMDDACKKNRMIQWICRSVLRNIHICRDSIVLNDITDEERKVILYWFYEFIHSLPYLRVIADKIQICSILSLYNDRRVTESVFRELDTYSSTYLPIEYQDSLKHYYNALQVILNEEVDEDLRKSEYSILTNMDTLESLLETLVPTYHTPEGDTATLYYEDEDIRLTLSTEMTTVSDTSQSLFDAAVDFVIQFITNAGARHWLVDKIRLAESIRNNDEYLKFMTDVFTIAKDFDYITPTMKRSVIAEGGVIRYDSSDFQA